MRLRKYRKTARPARFPVAIWDHIDVQVHRRRIGPSRSSSVKLHHSQVAVFSNCELFLHWSCFRIRKLAGPIPRSAPLRNAFSDMCRNEGHIWRSMERCSLWPSVRACPTDQCRLRRRAQVVAHFEPPNLRFRKPCVTKWKGAESVWVRPARFGYLPSKPGNPGA